MNVRPLRKLAFIILLLAGYAHAEMVPFWQDSGAISVSMDANGNNDPEGGTIRVDKPGGATVRKAFLMAASYGERVIKNGDVLLENEAIMGLSPSSPLLHNRNCLCHGTIKA